MSAGCIEWTGARDRRGYGQVKINGKKVAVHRSYWEEVNGPIPEGMVVMHTCDNPPCFRLDHLRLGTQADNIADMMAKGRHRSGITRNFGEANGMTHLTWEQVDEIREAIAAGEIQRRIAERYGVAPSTITRIKKREVWR